MSEDEEAPVMMELDEPQRARAEPPGLRALRQLHAHKGTVNPQIPKPRSLRAPPGKIRCPVCRTAVQHCKLKKHVEDHHTEQLQPGSKHRASLEAVFRTQAKFLCTKCHAVTAKPRSGLCPKCHKLQALDSEQQTKKVLTDEDKRYYKKRIMKRRKQRLTTYKNLPTRALRRKFSDAQLATTTKLANAKTDRDEWRAHFEMATIKALLIVPLGAGNQKRAHNRKMTDKLLTLWEEGKFQSCWDIAKGLEDRRVAGKRRRWRQMRKLRGKPPKKRYKISRISATRYEIAAHHAREGDFRRSVTIMSSHGVAKPVGDTLKQLDGMQPKRQTEVTPPTKAWLREERKRYETKESTPEMPELEQSPEPPEVSNLSSWRDLPRPRAQVPQQPPVEDAADDKEELDDLLEESYVPVVISVLDVLKVSQKAPKGSGGGLDQQTPYLWRCAIADSTGNRLAKVVARIANRTLRGHYSKDCGEVFASCRLVALYKDKRKVKVRPRRRAQAAHHEGCNESGPLARRRATC